MKEENFRDKHIYILVIIIGILLSATLVNLISRRVLKNGRFLWKIDFFRKYFFLIFTKNMFCCKACFFKHDFFCYFLCKNFGFDFDFFDKWFLFDKIFSEIGFLFRKIFFYLLEKSWHFCKQKFPINYDLHIILKRKNLGIGEHSSCFNYLTKIWP